MTSDMIHALAVAGVILIGVVVLIIIVTVVTVRRGEASMMEDGKHGRSHP